jgi:hypothetical protein
MKHLDENMRLELLANCESGILNVGLGSGSGMQNPAGFCSRYGGQIGSGWDSGSKRIHGLATLESIRSLHG